MNEIMELDEINRNDEEKESIRDPRGYYVPKNKLGRSCKATKLSEILKGITAKIKSLPKRT